LAVFGCGRPLLLNPLEGREKCFRLQGECFVYGIMNCEAFLRPLSSVPSKGPSIWRPQWREYKEGVNFQYRMSWNLIESSVLCLVIQWKLMETYIINSYYSAILDYSIIRHLTVYKYTP
jgi:integral membrane sensor domain MASE1